MVYVIFMFLLRASTLSNWLVSSTYLHIDSIMDGGIIPFLLSIIQIVLGIMMLMTSWSRYLLRFYVDEFSSSSLYPVNNLGIKAIAIPPTYSTVTYSKYIHTGLCRNIILCCRSCYMFFKGLRGIHLLRISNKVYLIFPQVTTYNENGKIRSTKTISINHRSNHQWLEFHYCQAVGKLSNYLPIKYGNTRLICQI